MNEDRLDQWLLELRARITHNQKNSNDAWWRGFTQAQKDIAEELEHIVEDGSEPSFQRPANEITTAGDLTVDHLGFIVRATVGPKGKEYVIEDVLTAVWHHREGDSDKTTISFQNAKGLVPHSADYEIDPTATVMIL